MRAAHWMAGPILFLDIDGVLNSWDYARRVPGQGILGIDPEAVTHLQRIVDETDCSIVLSSTWRKLHSLSSMREKLIGAGMRSPVPLRDKTPDLDKRQPSGLWTTATRGMEVNAWIDQAGYKGRYVCLDDDRDFLPGQPLVKTEFATGLTAEIADQVIAMLRPAPTVTGKP